jgi:hypothetical protein
MTLIFPGSQPVLVSNKVNLCTSQSDEGTVAMTVLAQVMSANRELAQIGVTWNELVPSR